MRLPLAHERKPFYRIEEDTRPGQWRVIDTSTGQVMLDHARREWCWAWVRKAKTR